MRCSRVGRGDVSRLSMAQSLVITNTDTVYRRYMGSRDFFAAVRYLFYLFFLRYHAQECDSDSIR